MWHVTLLQLGQISHHKFFSKSSKQSQHVVPPKYGHRHSLGRLSSKLLHVSLYISQTFNYI